MDDAGSSPARGIGTQPACMSHTMITIPEGWRELQPHEIISVGDKYAFCNDDWAPQTPYATGKTYAHDQRRYSDAVTIRALRRGQPVAPPPPPIDYSAVLAKLDTATCGRDLAGRGCRPNFWTVVADPDHVLAEGDWISHITIDYPVRPAYPAELGEPASRLSWRVWQFSAAAYAHVLTQIRAALVA